MGRSWRYIAQRLTGDGQGEFLDFDVPLEDPEIVDVISGDNTLQGHINPAYRRLLGPDGLPILKPWATAIWAENDGDIRGGGILNDVSFDGPTLNVDCVGFTGYLSGMPYTGGGYAGVGVDPLDIVRVIWNHVQTQPNGNLGLQIASTTTGGKVKIGTQLTQQQYAGENGTYTYQSGPYKLAWYQDNDLSGNINDLASETPFDFHERHYWVGDEIHHTLDLGYPKLGSRRNDLRFVVGVNIFPTIALDESGDDYATDVLFLGAGEGNQMVRGQAYRERTGLRRVAVVSDSSVRKTATANSRATTELAWRKALDEVSQVEVRSHPNAPLGSVSVGDEIYIEGRLDWRTIGTWMRVTQISIQPNNANTAVYTVARTDKLSLPPNSSDYVITRS